MPSSAQKSQAAYEMWNVFAPLFAYICIQPVYLQHAVLDGYCSTVQGLLDWFEVDLRFTELLFIQIGLCVMCVFVLYSPVYLQHAMQRTRNMGNIFAQTLLAILLLPHRL